MAVEDISDYELPKEEKDDILEIEQVAKNVSEFPEPTDEPYIGVLDTAFDKRVYFEKWVDYEERYMDDLQILLKKTRNMELQLILL